MVEVDLGALFTHDINNALAHFRNIETGRRGDLRQAHPHARQIGDRCKQVALLRQLLKDFGLGHNQPLVFHDTALVDFQAALQALQNVIDLVLNLFLDGTGNFAFYALLNAFFHGLLYALLNDKGNTVLYRGFNGVFNRLLDGNFYDLLHRLLNG